MSFLSSSELCFIVVYCFCLLHWEWVCVCVCVQQHIICHWVENTRSDKKVKQENDTQFKALAESGKGCYLKFTVPNWISFDVVHNTFRKLALSLVVSIWSAVKLRTVCKQSNVFQEIYFYRQPKNYRNTTNAKQLTDCLGKINKMIEHNNSFKTFLTFLSFK